MARDEFAEFDDAGSVAEETAEIKTEELVEQALQEPEQEPVAEPQEPEPTLEDQPQAEEEPAAGTEPEMVPISRFEEVNQRARKAEEQRDEVMQMLLKQGLTQSPQQPAAEPEQRDEIDPDVEALVRPILNRELSKFQGVEQLLEEKQRQADLTELDGLMPGFSEHYWPKVQEEFQKLPAEMQPQFDSKVGALALAALIQKREGAPTTTDANTRTLANRAHNEGSPKAPTSSPGMTPEDVMNMNDDQFSKLVNSLRNQGGDPGGVDPLLR